MHGPEPAAGERLTHADVDLPPGAPLPFVFTPAQAPSPLVVSFPHVGLAWPPMAGPPPAASFAANSDYQVHRLYPDLARAGAASVRAVFSRMAVDLNRAPDDVTPELVPDHPAPRPRGPGERPWHAGLPRRPGLGVVWTRAVGGVDLVRPPLALAHFERRIERLYRPYHRALTELLVRRRRRFGFAILLDAHSMPGDPGADLVLGDRDGRACAPWVREIALCALSGTATGHLTLRRNVPYPGGEIVRALGRPENGVHALQIEVRRGLYMDERRQRLYTPAPACPGLHPRLVPALAALVRALATARPPARASRPTDPRPAAPPTGKP